MTLDIRRATTEGDIAACMTLRWRVFVEEQGVSPEDERDGTDEGAVHVIARSPDGSVVGAARYLLGGDVAKIGRVCVDQAARGKGHGADMVRFICATCGANRAALGAQVTALEFYERLGFEAMGEVFDDAGIPHRMMEKPLL